MTHALNGATNDLCSILDIQENVDEVRNNGQTGDVLQLHEVCKYQKPIGSRF